MRAGPLPAAGQPSSTTAGLTLLACCCAFALYGAGRYLRERSR